MSNFHSFDAQVDDPLADFERRLISIDRVEKAVYSSGNGPAVIVMAEMPGISPHVARFARWVRGAGFRVFMPSLFGRDGATPMAEEGAQVFQRACISGEFRAFGSGVSSPISDWLRGLARLAYAECGGRGVGAIGMCFTGNFALSMMLEPVVLAPVLCQPSLPLDEPGGLEISKMDLELVRSRLEQQDLSVLAYRFEGDKFCQAARFKAYSEALGERFIGNVLPDTAANSAVPEFFSKHVPTPHSVVTVHLVDREGEPTLRARDQILEFFQSRLIDNGG